MDDCYKFDLENDDNKALLQSQTWVVEPSGMTYLEDEPVVVEPEDFETTEFIIRAGCSRNILNHDVTLVDVFDDDCGSDCENYLIKN